MAQPNIDERVLKSVLKEALLETLEERRDLFREIFVEVLEDLALVDPSGDEVSADPSKIRGFFTALNGEA